MPLGIVYLSAYLKKNVEVEIKVLDFNVNLNRIENFTWPSFRDYFFEVLSKYVAKFEPDMVGISALFTTAFNNLIDLAEVTRSIRPNVFLIAGGNVPTVSYRDIFAKTKVFDAICYGEGELPVLGLLNSKEWKAYVQKNSSWVTREKSDQGIQFESSQLTDLDEIPYDYSVITPDDYEINPTVTYYPSVRAKGKSFNIMTSRGCPYRCIFCASHRTHGRKMRYYSVDRVKADISRLVNAHGVKVITIEDDHFMGDKERAYEIVSFIGQLGVTAFFPNSLALFALTREMLMALKKAGVDQLVLAVESGSAYVLKNVMKKPLNLDIVRRVAQDCYEIGIYTDCNILIGLPGERKCDIEESRAFLRTVGANWFRINVATPLIGSEMYEICEKMNYFVGDVLEGNYKKAIICTDEFTPQYIQDTSYDMNIELNFVYNADMKRKDYVKALIGFENAISVKPTHAIALYFASVCYRELGDMRRADEYILRAREAIAVEPIWKKYVTLYRLPLFAG